MLEENYPFVQQTHPTANGNYGLDDIL